MIFRFGHQLDLRNRGLWAAVILVLCLVLGIYRPLVAKDDDPFDLGSNNWVSYEHYSDKEKRFPTAEEKPSDEIASPPEMAEPPAPAVKEPPAPAPEVTVLKTVPKVARPTRSLNLNLPVMPGYNQGYGVYVDSTEEGGSDEFDEGLKPSRPLNLPVMPGVNEEKTQDSAQGAGDSSEALAAPQDGLWKDAKTAAKSVVNKGSVVQVPINVRLATLPDERQKAVPGSPIIRPHKKEMVARNSKKSQDKKAEEKKVSPEACAAVTAFRKKQLEAIESDRKTLNALQAAISELGLDKKLDFTNGASQTLTAVPKIESAKVSEPIKPKDDKEASPSSEVKTNRP